MSSAIATSSLLPEPAPRRHEEDDLQRAVFQYLELALPHDGMAYAIPNGGKRHKREAARMKGLGLRPGMPDIGLCITGRALYLELKAAKGWVSRAQNETANRLRYCGAPVGICRSVPDVERWLELCGVHLRASVSA